MVVRDVNHRLLDLAMAAGPGHSDGVSGLVELPRHNATAERNPRRGRRPDPACSR